MPMWTRTALMNEDEKKRSMFLYELLASLLRGRLLTVLRGIPENNGYEALRQLVMQCQPTSRNRSLGILNALMSWKEFDMKGALLCVKEPKLKLMSMDLLHNGHSVTQPGFWVIFDDKQDRQQPTRWSQDDDMLGSWRTSENEFLHDYQHLMAVTSFRWRSGFAKQIALIFIWFSLRMAWDGQG